MSLLFIFKVDGDPQQSGFARCSKPYSPSRLNRSYYLKKSFFFLALACAQACVKAAGPLPAVPAAAVPHPLAGSWSWSLPGQQCAETWKYRADGIRESSSGEEVTKSNYQVAPQPSITGFYRLTEIVTESNAKKDCSGDLHQVSAEPLTRFIQFSPDLKQLIVCRQESLKACFGPLQRSPDLGQSGRTGPGRIVHPN